MEFPEGPFEVEVIRRKIGKSQVRLQLDADAVAECLRKDGTLTIHFREVGSTELTDLPSAEVIVN